MIKNMWDSRWRYFVACVRHHKVRILWRMFWWRLTDRRKYWQAWRWAILHGVYNVVSVPKGTTLPKMMSDE